MIPEDIEVLMADDGIYIEIESFIRFLRNNKNVPEEYVNETIYLNKIAEYLENQMGELILQKQLLNGKYNTECPN